MNCLMRKAMNEELHDWIATTQIKMTQELYQKYQRIHYRQNTRIMAWVFRIGVGIAYIMLLCCTLLGYKVELSTILLATAAVAWCFFLFSHTDISADFYARRTWKKIKQKRYECQWYENGFSVSFEDTIETYSYRVLKKIVETDELMICYIRTRNAYLLDKSTLDEQQVMAIQEAMKDYGLRFHTM